MLGGDRGAFASTRPRGAGSLGAAPGAASMGELRQVRPERMGVGVGEPRQRTQIVTSGAAQPLWEHPRRDAKVGAVFGEGVLFGLPRVGPQRIDLVAQVHPHDVEQARLDDGGNVFAPFPNRLPVI